MTVTPSFAWKLVLGIALLAAIILAARARAPRRALPHGDMRRLVASALGLYVVGGVAWFTRHIELAVLVYAAGIAIAALAAWLSRGDDSEEDPPWEDDPVSEQPPPDPDGLRFDWDAFERDLRDYVERPRTASPVSD